MPRRANWGELALAIEAKAELFESEPSAADPKTCNRLELAALIILGRAPVNLIPPSAVEWHGAIATVREWRDRFKSYNEIDIPTELQARIRWTFRSGSGRADDLAKFVRNPQAKELRSLATACLKLADRIGAASSAASSSVREAANGLDLKQTLRDTAEKLEREAEETARRAGRSAKFVGTKPGPGRPRNEELHHVVWALADVWAAMTGDEPTAHYLKEEGDRPRSAGSRDDGSAFKVPAN